MQRRANRASKELPIVDWPGRVRSGAAQWPLNQLVAGTMGDVRTARAVCVYVRARQ